MDKLYLGVYTSIKINTRASSADNFFQYKRQHNSTMTVLVNNRYVAAVDMYVCLVKL